MSEELRGRAVVVDCCGSLFYAEKSPQGYYICPICRTAVFFTEKDLILHLGSHARKRLRFLHKVPKRKTLPHG